MRLDVIAISLLLSPLLASAQNPGDGFFETRIRPLFASQCAACHSDKLQMGGLNLMSAHSVLQGDEAGPVVVKGDPEASRLIQAVLWKGSLKMPPAGKLGDEEIEALTAWVKAGAPWPNAELGAPGEGKKWDTAKQDHWAFQPVRDPQPPQVKDSAWVRSPIDRFILARLKAKGIRPAPPADKLTLLRRAKYDLHGLPPTPEEVRDFLADERPDAFARLVDRLLASPRYGERWGRHWMDVARYADSTGLDEDHRYPYAWRYRDYVIEAFNTDLPYDRFVREQIAGDLLPSPTPGALNTRGIVATGYLALGPKPVAQQDKMKMVYDVVDEQIDVVSKGFLGLTMACARCHDHKFDPILTRDYYSFASIFASTKNFEDWRAHVSKLYFEPLVPKEEYETYQQGQEAVKAKKRELEAVEEAAESDYILPLRARLADYMLAAREAQKSSVEQVAQAKGLDARVLGKWAKFLSPSGGVTYLEDWYKAGDAEAREIAADFQTRFDKTAEVWDKRLARWRESVQASIRSNMTPPDRPRFDATEDRFFHDVYIDRGAPLTLGAQERQQVFSKDVLARMETLKGEVEALEKAAPPEPPMACAVAEGEPVAQKIFVRGNHLQPGDPVERSFPAVIQVAHQPEFRSASGRRELAEWLAQPDHPLTGRVFVNRVWGWHFGRAIVATTSNFGTTGEKPTHPELLDYLTKRFVENDWSAKYLHRLIMNSSAYQMSSEVSNSTYEADPGNDLYSRFNRRRLSAEEMRDSFLAVDSAIDFTMGGTLQSGFGTDRENSNDRLSIDPKSTNRRTVYLPLRRSNLATMLTLFDFGDATSSTGERMSTNVAPQALFMMNSDFINMRSEALAKDLLDTAGSDSERLEELYLRAFARTPTPGEKDELASYLAAFARNNPERTPLEGWQSLCRIVLGSNEFQFVD